MQQHARIDIVFSYNFGYLANGQIVHEAKQNHFLIILFHGFYGGKDILYIVSIRNHGQSGIFFYYFDIRNLVYGTFLALAFFSIKIYKR